MGRVDEVWLLLRPNTHTVIIGYSEGLKPSLFPAHQLSLSAVFGKGVIRRINQRVIYFRAYAMKKWNPFC